MSGPELHERVARIETYCEAILKNQEDHGERLASLEKWKSWVVGVCASAGAIAGFVWKELTK